MAELPHPEQVRVLLTDPKTPGAELDKIGDTFLAAGRPSVAAMFYERARTPDRIRRILEAAEKEGDAFLMDWVARVAADLATPEAWERVGDAAMKAGRLSFARQAFEKAGKDGKTAEAAHALLQVLNAQAAPAAGR